MRKEGGTAAEFIDRGRHLKHDIAELEVRDKVM